MFRIIRYLKPIWYFNLRPQIDHGYFPDSSIVRKLMPELNPDDRFSDKAKIMELAFRAHRSGVVNLQTGAGLDWWRSDSSTIKDEYLFAFRYFNPLRVFMAFLVRIFTFHNPFTETAAFLSAFKLKDSKKVDPVASHDGYQSFESELIKVAPHVRVIIPTLNRYDYLKDVLCDLEKQTYTNFSVAVIDQSDHYRKEFYDAFNLRLDVIRQEEKALWRARNRAVENTDSEYLLLYDDDSRVDSDWIAEHLKCLDYFNADISSGVSISAVGAAVPFNYSFFRWSDQIDTGNVMIKKSVFRKVGLFDTQFEKQRMGDGEFGIRAYLAGFRNISNPRAKRLHLKVGQGGLRDMGHWDAFRPKNIWSPRPVPSVLFYYRKYYGTKSAIMALMQNIPPSIIPYKYKRSKPALLLGSLLALIVLPLIFIQIIRSWRVSSEMLMANGIKYLDEQA